jgi:uncharacterized protein DUF4439
MTSLIAALESALAVEHRVVYGYGLVGGRLIGAELVAAQDAYAAHETRRDVLTDWIASRGARPVVAAPAYATVTPVTSRVEAIALAQSLEADCAAAYATVLGAARSADLRRHTTAWLRESAVSDVRWRQLLGPASVSSAPALPGLSFRPAPRPS